MDFKPVVAIFVAAVWLLGATSVVGALAYYSQQPAAWSAPPRQLPHVSTLQKSLSHPTLLLFLHPKCACSEASVESLFRVLAQSSDVTPPPDITAIFYQPLSTSEAFVTTSALYEKVSGDAHIRKIIDPSGRIAQAFHVTTSGSVVLYSASGQRLFWGGITPARGHHGDSVGQTRLTQALHGQFVSSEFVAPVFGCALFESSTESTRENS